MSARVREAPKQCVGASGCPCSHVADIAISYLGLLSGNSVDIIIAAASQGCHRRSVILLECIYRERFSHPGCTSVQVCIKLAAHTTSSPARINYKWLSAQRQKSPRIFQTTYMLLEC